MTDYDRQLFVLVPLALTLILVGLVQIVVPRASIAWRILVSGALFAPAFAAVGLFAESATFDLLAIASLPASIGLALAVRALAGRLPALGCRRTILAGVAIIAAGAALLAASIVHYETELAKQVEADSGDMELLGYVPEREIDLDSQLVTDRGRSIQLWRTRDEMPQAHVEQLESRCLRLVQVDPSVVQIGPADVRTNCHGWVFTGGRSILANGDVETILADNGYRVIERPEVGDIAIYRNNGLVSHTGRVTAVESDRPVTVESKWSWMGVYRHAVDRSIYGAEYTFYRTSRSEHVAKIADRSTLQYGGAE